MIKTTPFVCHYALKILRTFLHLFEVLLFNFALI